MDDETIFLNRSDAGKRLAEKLLDFGGSDALVLAIPRGGVPVGFEVAQRLSAELDVIVPRKIPIPWNPEAGLGAVTADGTTVVNEPLARELGLTDDEVNAEAEEVRQEVARRTERYRRGDRPFPRIGVRPVILVDDGLASGYTMLAAIDSLKRYGPHSIVVAVPVASAGAARLVSPHVDRLVVLTVSSQLPFAVADFYAEWRDLTDEEVVSCLDRAAGLRRAA